METRVSHKYFVNGCRELIKNNDDIDFAFVDINCSLGFRYTNGSFRYFNSENELHNLINK